MESPWQDSPDLRESRIILAHEPKTAQEPEPDSPSFLSSLGSLESGWQTNRLAIKVCEATLTQMI